MTALNISRQLSGDENTEWSIIPSIGGGLFLEMVYGQSRQKCVTWRAVGAVSNDNGVKL